MSEEETHDPSDPWEEMGIGMGGYSAAVDHDVISMLRAIRSGWLNVQEGKTPGYFVTDLMEVTGLSRTHVELYQYIFCSRDWCNYGGSPRGCWPEDPVEFDAIIERWERHYEKEWGEPA